MDYKADVPTSRLGRLRNAARYVKDMISARVKTEQRQKSVEAVSKKNVWIPNLTTA